MLENVLCPSKNLGIGCLFEFPPKWFRWPGASCFNPNFPSAIIWNGASSCKTLACEFKQEGYIGKSGMMHPRGNSTCQRWSATAGQQYILGGKLKFKFDTPSIRNNYGGKSIE